jgi:large subunit ribosomal protein L25
MKTVSLSGSLRENVGKKDAKKNRNEGKIPCVLYGGKEEIHFAVEDKSFKPIVFTPYAHIVNLNIAGNKYAAVLQDIQYHPVSDEILHADFLELVEGKPINVTIPIRITGSSTGVLRGGKLVKKYRKLKVRGLAADIPNEITIDITNLEINDNYKVSDIKIDKVKLLDYPTSVIISVESTRAVTEGETPKA